MVFLRNARHYIKLVNIVRGFYRELRLTTFRKGQLLEAFSIIRGHTEMPDERMVFAMCADLCNRMHLANITLGSGRVNLFADVFFHGDPQSCAQL